MNYSDFFIAIYTHECKEYCDEQFYNHLLNNCITSDLRGEAIIRIVDNSIDNSYVIRLLDIIGQYKNNPEKVVSHLHVPRDDINSQFQRNVAESAIYLRNLFLQTDCKYFVIIESDVLPPKLFLNYFNEVIDQADVIGGIYYHGWHKEEYFNHPNLFTDELHVLSGCTLYKREIIEKFPFRFSYENLGAFPDAWICYDINKHNEDNGKKIYNMSNYTKIKCDHLEKPGSINRGQDMIV